MVKSFKADFRQGGQSILDDVYVRGCLYVNGDCGIIIQDKANPSSSGRLYIEDNTLKIDIVIEEGPGNPGSGGVGGGGGSGSGGGTISVGGGNVTVVQVGYSHTNPISVNNGNEIAISSTSNAFGARYISTETPTAGVGTVGDIWFQI